MKNALDSIDILFSAGRPCLFLDFDGTLAEIAPRPFLAVLDPAVRDTLQELTRNGIPVAIISGRELEDLRSRIALPEMAYGGSHGFDLLGPPPACERFQPGAYLLPVLDAVDAELRARLASLPGIFMERKRFAFAVHYRQVDERWLGTVEREVLDAVTRHPGVQMREGKKVFEMLPDIPWDKGEAVKWLLQWPWFSGTPVYVGDDVSDEDGFRAVSGRGVGIVVQERPGPTAAGYRLRDPAEVAQFLRRVAERCLR